jgi:monoamine oxidase
MISGKSGLTKLISRRDTLKVLGLGAAGALIPVELGGQSDQSRETDVVVVGAGFAGLIAARNLLRAGKRVVLLEARDRVGGRVKGGKLAGHPVDLGGMWVGPTQTRLLALINEYAFHTTPQFDRGKAIADLNGKRSYTEVDGTGLDSAAQAEYDRLVGELNRLSRQVPLDAPWTMRQAEQLDTITVEQWVESQTKNRDFIALLQLSTRTIFTADPFQMSLLYFLFYLHSGDNFEALLGFENSSAQAFLVKETMHQLAVRVSKEIEKSLVLEAPVTEIAQDENGVTVKSAKADWRGSYAIVAVPLPLSVRISYRPALPPERDILAQHMPMGSVIKCLLAYDKPFWRARGLNGVTWSDAPPTAGFFDISPADGEVGILGAFIEAHNAINWTGHSMQERRKLMVERIVSFFGPEAANPIDYEDQDWPSEIWSRGCYGATMAPGIMTTAAKTIRQPFGRIHWAGTETSPRWMGYIDGAIRSGERAADEVQTRLKRI